MDSDGCEVAIRLLGDFRIGFDGRSIDAEGWPTRRAAELVQLLAITDRHTLPREQVMDALWPELEAGAAAANLRKAAHHARRALGDDEAVVLGGGQVRLFPGAALRTDLDAFERRARAALGAQDPAACAEAAELYGGVLLPSSRYEAWTEPARSRLHQLYTQVLAGAGHWQRLLEIDPANETATRALMLARLEAGDRHGAIRAYGRLRAALAETLGLPPSSEVDEIYQRCVAGLAATDPALVGRDEELATAQAALLSAQRGEVGLLAIRGPAGIGKSALLHVIADTVDGRGWLVASVCAAPTGEPYASLASLVDQLLAVDPTLLDQLTSRARQVLATVSVMARTAEPPLGELTRHQVAGALRQLVAAVGDPVALVVDDAHLADVATIEVLVHLAGSDAGAPSLAVLAFRDVPPHPALQSGVARLSRGRRAVRIDVGPLPRDALRALVAASVPEGTDDDVIDDIVQRADGSPFFAQQLVEGLHEVGAPSLTATARDAVTQRMVNHLDEPSVGMLERLAVAGNDLALDDVEAMTGLSGPEAGMLLDRAIAAGVLHVAGVRYRFRHDLTRQALVERLPPHQRESVHRDAAQRLTQAAGPPARIAAHWLGGRRPQQAVPWLLEAGERALRVGAFADARSHFERLLHEVPDHPRALRGRARALDALGDPEAPVAHAAAARVADEETAAEIRAHQALAQLRAGDPSGALDTLAGVTTRSLAGQVAEALTLCGAAMLGVADVDTAARRAQRARQAAMDDGDPTAVTDTSWAMSLAAHARHELVGLLETELLATRDMPGLAARVFDGYLCTTEALLYGGPGPGRVIAFADELAAEARRTGALRGEAFAVTVRGEARLLADDLEAAARDLVAGAELYREIGAPGGRSLALQRQAEVVLAGEGDHDQAARLLRSALAAARDSDLSHHLLDRIYGTRIVAARTPDEIAVALDEGELAIRGPLESCPPCRITFAIPAAVGAARLGDVARAEPHVQMAELLTATIWADTGWVAALDEVYGHLARARGEPEVARTHFQEAVRGFEEAGQVRDARRCADLLAAPAGRA